MRDKYYCCTLRDEQTEAQKENVITWGHMAGKQQSQLLNPGPLITNPLLSFP